ncbi:MAG: trans-aconitate 2-methyltransferase [Actinobacteria bacterium]|nr:trans-aconitate 2-methyltransferase [Actinomycetota bacterium]
MWDPAQYLNFADERSRPFFELAGRIGAAKPDYVVDLGCGPGQLTAALAQRWAHATVLGIDSSAEMIEAAVNARYGGDTLAGRLSFSIGDVRDFSPDRPVDVIISNAVLQWVPGHRDLLPRWAEFLAPGGWLAFQLPGNFDQPSHAVLRELAGSDRWRDRLAGVELNRQAGEPDSYLDQLARAGLVVDAWETTYLHVLHGPDPVTEWYKGSGLRPVLAALEPAEASEFVRQYGERVRAAYPAAPYGTVLPFRRVFVVAHRLEQ